MSSLSFVKNHYSEKSNILYVYLEEKDLKAPYKKVKVWSLPCPCVETTFKAVPTIWKIKYNEIEVIKDVVKTEYEVTEDLYNAVINNASHLNDLVMLAGAGVRKIANEIITQECGKIVARGINDPPEKIGFSRHTIQVL